MRSPTDRPGPRFQATFAAGFVRSLREIVAQRDESTGRNRYAEYPSLLVGPDVPRLAVPIPDPKVDGVTWLSGNIEAFVANDDDGRRNRSSPQRN